MVEGRPEKKQQRSLPIGRSHFPEKASREKIQKVAEAEFSSLIIVAQRYSPTSLIEKTVCLLASSATFAVFSPWLEPLVECRVFLQEKKLAVAMQLSETFWREHQVLPGRSHPHMNMTTGPSSGYILSGIATIEAPRYSPKAEDKQEIGTEQERVKNSHLVDQVNKLKLEVDAWTSRAISAERGQEWFREDNTRLQEMVGSLEEGIQTLNAVDVCLQEIGTAAVEGGEGTETEAEAKDKPTDE